MVRIILAPKRCRRGNLAARVMSRFVLISFAKPTLVYWTKRWGLACRAGVGEDTYLFYKVLSAGYTIVYEPGAYVWHRHRRDLRALCRQIYNYSKGTWPTT